MTTAQPSLEFNVRTRQIKFILIGSGRFYENWKIRLLKFEWYHLPVRYILEGIETSSISNR